MAQNIWNATLDVDNSVKQNPFDWTHLNNLTTQIGRITPVFCDLVPAKTSFRVHQEFGLQFMPMTFPIQTRLRASISWFRYPLRALWKDYKDYVGNFREGLVEPYINLNTGERLKKMAGTGSLGDYLGVPSTRVGTYGSVNYTYTGYAADSSGNSVLYGVPSSEIAYSLPISDVNLIGRNLSALRMQPTDVQMYRLAVYTSTTPEVQLSSGKFILPIETSSDRVELPDYLAKTICLAVSNNKIVAQSVSSTIGSSSGSKVNFEFKFSSDVLVADTFAILTSYYGESNWNHSVSSGVEGTVFKYYPSVFEDGVTIRELDLSTSPWYSSLSTNKEKQIKLAAYAFRAYEGIYNSMYRDNRNNPYYINGVVQYNQWIPSYDGGEDNNLYELRYANWEKDFLTTSVQSPQQGNAPLVGITTYETGKMLDNGAMETRVALVDEDGKRYSIEYQHDEDGLKGVNYVELDNGTVVRSARNLMDLATSGISIPDLRLVNCYQKYLELNMRKGYSYKDIVEGRFDVKVRYADLLLPEFFGGTSRDMNMNAISQTVDQDTAGKGTYKEALGSQSGVGYFTGSSKGNIECFCDEESIIMGLLVITPLPVYTQLLPKHFTYRNLLDHFNPEFNNIGFQPISYKEVCPIQTYNDNPDALNNTFGYQRPWYEYAQRYDVAHGLFRTQLSNFLMHRVFNQKPELAQSFLTIDPEQVTDVFSVTETTDKVYGQIRLNITAKLPIARVAIPRLD